MPFVRCGACHQKFRIPENSYGEKRACPHCNAMIAIPFPTASQESFATNKGSEVSGGNLANATKSVTTSQWYVKTAIGQTFGPISRDELNSWVTECRITAQDQVLQEGSEQWQWASDVFPTLQNHLSVGTGASSSQTTHWQSSERDHSHHHKQEDVPGLISLILGCVSMFLLLASCCLVFTAPLAFLLAIPGAIVGFWGKGNLRIAGLILNFIVIALCVIGFFLALAIIAANPLGAGH